MNREKDALKCAARQKTQNASRTLAFQIQIFFWGDLRDSFE
jgi:hypothetical protein